MKIIKKALKILKQSIQVELFEFQKPSQTSKILQIHHQFKLFQVNIMTKKLILFKFLICITCFPINRCCFISITINYIIKI